MPVQSCPPAAVVAITRTIVVAEGRYAPGHLGELTQIVPFELADDLVERHRATQRRLRDLPTRVGLYFVLAMTMFPDVGYRLVWKKMVAALAAAGVAVASPSGKALRDLRRRVGIGPVKELFWTLAVPLAPPTAPGVCWRGLHTVAFDGCTSIKVPDRERNTSWLSKIMGRVGPAGYPLIELMALVETGTRGLLGAVFGPSATGESDYARQLLPLVKPGMLVLNDRGFDGNAFLADLAATGADFLTRLKSTRRPRVVRVLRDGSYLARLGGLTVRIIEADVTIRLADGTTVRDTYRLATTLTDPRRYPAAELIALYHERWEIELAFYSLRHTLMKHLVLRSCDPVGVEQEMWANLATYQAIRMTMVDAALAAGMDADRCSFTIAFETAKDQLVNAAGVTLPAADTTDPGMLIGQIAAAVLADPMPPRRLRLSQRKVKSPLSRYYRADPSRPARSTAITEIIATVHEPGTPPEPAARPISRPRRRPALMQTPLPVNIPRPQATDCATSSEPDPPWTWTLDNLDLNLTTTLQT